MIGCIARCDDGGLGTMTVEFVRHVKPDVVLVVMPTAARGTNRLDRIDAPLVLVADWPSTDDDPWLQLVGLCDAIYTAETPYHPHLPAWCAMTDTRLVVHAMPEYYRWGDTPPFDVWAPTYYRLDQLPRETPVVPVPVDLDRLKRRDVTRVRRVLHISSGAHYDRNGTHLLKRALVRCREPFELVIGGVHRPTRSVSRVTVETKSTVDEYWQWYEDVDALVMPRRYGGLSLPMQEAAACGLPVVMLATDANAEWTHPDLRVPTKPARTVRMSGGIVFLGDCHPADLAATLDRLVSGPVSDYTETSAAHGDSLDWRAWSGLYAALLGRV